MSSHRCAAWLAGVWTGLLACIGAMAAPAAFATLAAADAGRYAGRLFLEEAYLSLALAVLLFVLLRLGQSRAGAGTSLSTELILVLATIFCTVAGYFAVQPLMAAARVGEGRWSFAALHAVSGSLFILKAVSVALLAWRLTLRNRGLATPGATS